MPRLLLGNDPETNAVFQAIEAASLYYVIENQSKVPLFNKISCKTPAKKALFFAGCWYIYTLVVERFAPGGTQAPKIPDRFNKVDQEGNKVQYRPTHMGESMLNGDNVYVPTEEEKRTGGGGRNR